MTKSLVENIQDLMTQMKLRLPLHQIKKKLNMDSTKKSCVEGNIPVITTDLNISCNNDTETISEQKYENKRYQGFNMTKTTFEKRVAE